MHGCILISCDWKKGLNLEGLNVWFWTGHHVIDTSAFTPIYNQLIKCCMEVSNFKVSKPTGHERDYELK